MRSLVCVLAALFIACSDAPVSDDDGDDTAEIDERDAAARPLDGGTLDAAKLDARAPTVVPEPVVPEQKDAALVPVDMLDASTQGADASEPTATAVDSELASCKAMLGSYCRKAKQCGLIANADECLRFNLAACPDVLFSTGSPRTIEQTRDCAEKLPSMSCQALISTPRVCDAPSGTLPDGAECVFTSQCQGACTQNSGNACGQCVPWVGAGGVCGGSLRQCDAMHACVAGICRVRVPASSESARLCAAKTDCETGELCDFPSSMLSSDPDTRLGTCLPIPAAGQPCTANGACGPNAYCKSDRTCAAHARIGEACTVLAACEPSALCDANVCRARRATAGQECTGGCVVGTACSLVSGSATLRCFRLRVAGQSCTDAFDQCPVNTKCDGSVCKPDGLQDLFEEACNP